MIFKRDDIIFAVVVAFVFGFIIRGCFSSPSSMAGVELNNEGSPSFIEKEFRVTAYCSCDICCGECADGITANGHRIQFGDKLVAAPKEYSFGTMFDIAGYGKAPVLDRGGAIKNSRIDVLFYEKSQDKNMSDLEWSHQLALQWGIKYLKVKIYKKEGE